MTSKTLSCAFAALLVVCLVLPALGIRGDLTWYNLGMTACGRHHNNNEMVAAVAFRYFTTPNPNNDPMCRRRARIRDPASGRTVEVSIQDKCGGCKMQDIDVSPAAFQRLRPLSAGRFQVDWNFI